MCDVAFAVTEREGGWRGAAWGVYSLIRALRDQFLALDSPYGAFFITGAGKYLTDTDLWPHGKRSPEYLMLISSLGNSLLQRSI